MCHTIKSTNSFFAYHDDWLVGLKLIHPVEHQLFSPFFPRLRPYSIAKHKLGYEISHNVEGQNICFKISVKRYNYSNQQLYDDVVVTHSICDAGIHIRPFTNNLEDVGMWGDFDQDIRVLVLFRLKDVIFYDGVDVSVSKFVLPNPAVLESVLKNKSLGEINLFVDYESFDIENPTIYLKQYGEIFNSLKITEEK